MLHDNLEHAGRLTSQVNRRSNGTIIASQSFELDPNGNRTREHRREPEVPWSLATETVAMAFNATRTRLLEAGTDSFAYDGVGNRLRAARDGQVTRYVYDQAGNLLAEADGANNITRYYVHGAGLLATIEANNTYHYHFDALGSTVALTDEAGAIVNAYAYSPYGRVINKTEGLSQPFQYVGQYGVMVEPEGLYYMRARYYDPEVGRFISEDPIGFEGGLNLYAYVGGNPVLLNDPSGECPWCFGFIIGAGSDMAMQVSGSLSDGHGFGDALLNINLTQSAVAGVAGSVGATVFKTASEAVKHRRLFQRPFESLTRQERVITGDVFARAQATGALLLGKKSIGEHSPLTPGDFLSNGSVQK